MVTQINGQSTLKLQADVIDIDGVINALGAKHVGCGSLSVEGFTELSNTECYSLYSYTTIGSANGVEVGSGGTAVWKQKEVVTSVTPVKTTSKQWALADGSTWIGQVMTSVSVGKATINYLGGADS
jgi:hypothetical protein